MSLTRRTVARPLRRFSVYAWDVSGDVTRHRFLTRGSARRWINRQVRLEVPGAEDLVVHEEW